MKQLLKAGLLATACSLVPGVASAQGTCSDGRTASGACVNATLADAMRQSAVIYSQPKLSYTAFPVLPALDFIFRYPHQLNADPLKPSPTGTPGL